MLKPRKVNLTTPPIIPSLDYFGDGPILHFAHANGYPPGSYRLLLDELAAHFHITAMYQRPLWHQTDPLEIDDWLPLANDMDQFFDQENLDCVIGVGHSLGATNTLRLAIRKPKRFSALILLDPVIFLPSMIYSWGLAYKLGLGMKFHPLAASTLKRRRTFPSTQEMFAHYRSKPIFERFPDESLQAYVEAATRPSENGGIELIYSPEWEAQIYLTGVLADLDLWKAFPNLRIPTLIIRGQETNTFTQKTAKRINQIAPQIQILTLPDTGHLLPLERPKSVANLIFDFLGKTPE